jgi:quercetin dioxygenase-like cupin family protein
LYVLEGKMRVMLGDTEYVLGQHDAISFDGNVPHLLTAISDEGAEYILSISPVVF